jgi:hypothetical protein
LLPVPTVEELGYGDISQVQVESRLIQRSSISVAAGSSLNFLMANCRRRFLHSEEGRQKLLGEWKNHFKIRWVLLEWHILVQFIHNFCLLLAVCAIYLSVMEFIHFLCFCRNGLSNLRNLRVTHLPSSNLQQLSCHHIWRWVLSLTRCR